MTYKMPKSREGAYRQYDAIIRAYKRTYSGGGMFGMDMDTFYYQAPEAYRHVKAIQAAYLDLPGRERDIR